FVNTTSGKFGLIIIDLFLDLRVPEKFFSQLFWQDISSLLRPEGKVLFNAGINSAHEVQIDNLLEKSGFDLNFRKKEEVYGSNTLLFAERD
ncbi:MAG: hypothetical protein R3209_11990, partial [Salinimicrobium sediminis]|nr:hypothetical protein [Salinimicrobium sediminis]